MKKIFAKYSFRIGTTVVAFSFGVFAVWFAIKIYPPVPEISSLDSYNTVLIPIEPYACYPELAVPLEFKEEPPVEPAAERETYSEPSACSPARILDVGEFWPDEVISKSGERWFALVNTSTGSALRETTITVRKTKEVENDRILHRGKEVIARNVPAATFLVRGIKGIRPGPLRTVFAAKTSEDWRYMQNQDSFKFEFGKKYYTLLVRSSDKEADWLPDDAELVMTDGEIAQTLYMPGPSGGDAGIQIEWIGDLDRDGKPDLVLNLNWHYNESIQTLYLSSHARKGKLVAPAASFRIVGC